METGSVRQSFCVPRNFGSNVTWPIEGKMHAQTWKVELSLSMLLDAAGVKGLSQANTLMTVGDISGITTE